MKRLLCYLMVISSLAACSRGPVRVEDVPPDVYASPGGLTRGVRPMRAEVFYACCVPVRPTPSGGEKAPVDRLVPVIRGVLGDGVTPDVKSVLDALFRGPGTGSEEELVTFIPTGTTYIRHTGPDDGVVTVDLSAELQAPGPALEATVRVAQVVWTLTRIAGINRVELKVNGEPISVVTASGETVKRPLTLEDFREPFSALDEVTDV